MAFCEPPLSSWMVIFCMAVLVEIPKKAHAFRGMTLIAEPGSIPG